MKKQKRLPAKFTWGPISRKQLQVLTWWRKGSPYMNRDIIICDGSIRAGKTVPMSFSYIEWAMSRFVGELFGITGKTIGSLRQNVVSPLKKILHGRGYDVDEKRSDKLLIITKGDVTNTFELFGGKDEASQDLIQGRTLAGILFDEVVLQPESFVNQGMGRCSVEGSKIWFNCNPEGPYHWFKVNFIDKIKELNGFRIHFTLDDNLTLSERIKRRYKSLFSGVFYKRFILGLWTVAEGLIYDMWNTSYIKKTSPEQRKIVAVDYGTTNPCTFGLYQFRDVKGHINLKREYYYDSKKEGKQKTDAEYADAFELWLGSDRPEAIYVDPSAASFIAELEGRGFEIKRADNSINDGIRFVSTLLMSGRFSVDPSCEDTIKEFSSYVWDKKGTEKGEDKPIKQNDHAMDRNRYALYTHFKKFIDDVVPIGLGDNLNAWRL